MKSFFKIKEQKFDEIYERELQQLRKSKKSQHNISGYEIERQATREACSELFDSEFDPNEANAEGTLLLNVLTTEKLEWVEFLVEKGADANLGHPEWGYPLEYATHLAARTGSKEIFKTLEPLTRTEIKHSIFISFTVNHEHQALQLLIDRAIDVDSPRELGSGQTPLMIAVRQGDDKMVKMLLQAGANPNFKDEVLGTTPLISAVRGQFVHLTRLLLEYGADVSLPDRSGKTAFEVAMNLQGESKPRERKIMALLIKAGVKNPVSLN